MYLGIPHCDWNAYLLQHACSSCHMLLQLQNLVVRLNNQANLIITVCTLILHILSPRPVMQYGQYHIHHIHVHEVLNLLSRSGKHET